MEKALFISKERGRRGFDVAADEVVELLVQVKTQEDPPAPAQHQDEGHQRPFGPADADLAEVAPVHLRLLARRSLQPQIRLGGLVAKVQLTL